MFANSLHQLYSANNMSLKNHAARILRIRGFSEKQIEQIIDCAIRSSILQSRLILFEDVLNHFSAFCGDADIFYD